MCGTCGGVGTVEGLSYGHGPDDYAVDYECPKCRGSGAAPSEPATTQEAMLAAAPLSGAGETLTDSLMLALKTIRDMPVEEQDNMISANMRLVAGKALAPMGDVTEADIAWAISVAKLDAKRAGGAT